MSLNILIVDDSSVIRSMIIKTLKMTDVPLGELHPAGTGQEGLDIIEDNWIDLLFVDINMPIMNGEEMLTRIRKNPDWASLPVIVVSTEGSQTRIERLKGLDAWFIHKPFTAEQVRDVVQEITGVCHE